MIERGRRLPPSSCSSRPPRRPPSRAKGVNALTPNDRASLREAYDAARHAARADGDGYRARNPGQRFETRFDGRGFTVHPREADWTWGLMLRRYGFAGAERTIDAAARVDADGARVTYRWSPTVDEWFVNDGRGVEHGYTVHQRPETGGADGPLVFTLEVLGDLRPTASSDGRSLRFDRQGRTVLHYAGLTVLDADGASVPAWMSASGDHVRISVDDSGARYPLVIDPLVYQSYLKASNTEDGDQFGSAAAISGNTAVIATPWEDSAATGANGNEADNSAQLSGAVYVFIKSGSTWVQQAYLKASNSEAFDSFGTNVAISGDTVVVGASGEDSATMLNPTDNTLSQSGAAYVFTRNGTTWSQEAYLKASNPGSGDQFGRAVAIHGDTVVIGARSEDSNATGVNGNGADNSAGASGAAYVFVRQLGSWSEEAYLKASNSELGDNFGSAVAISGDTIVVGSREDSAATGVNGDQSDNSASAAGAAYVFTRSGTTWSQEAYLKASNTEGSDGFGEALAIAGDTIVVGATGEKSTATGVDGNQADNGLSGAGAAYVFSRTGTTWGQEAYLKASSHSFPGGFFGGSVAIAGERVVVGADQQPVPGANIKTGAAYTFVRTGTTWASEDELVAPNPDAGDGFGFAVAISGSTVIVSAPAEDGSATGVDGPFDDNGDSTGAAYTFEVPVTPGPLALDLPGPKGYVAIQNAPELTPANGVTVEAWVVYDSSPSLRPTIFRKDPTPLGEAYVLRIENDRPYFRVVGTNGSNIVSPFITIPFDTPTHIAATYDNATSKIYVNGVEVASATHNSGPIVATAGEARIGQGDDAGGESFYGQLDAVRVWDHARSLTEVYGGMDRELKSSAGLVASWNFNGDLTDSAGTHDGTAMLTTGFAPEFTTYARAAEFPAAGGWIEVPHHDDFIPASGLTVEAWVEIDQFSSLATVLRKDPTGFVASYHMRVDNGRPYFAIKGDNGLIYQIVSSQLIPLDTPTHLAATYDGSAMKIFINGVLTDQVPAVHGPIGHSTGVFRIGYGDPVGGSSNQWIGRIDAVRVWKCAREEADIAATMDREISSLPGIIASYNMNGGFTDSAGGHDGVVTGGAVSLVEECTPLIGTPPGAAEVVGLPSNSCGSPLEIVTYGLPHLGDDVTFGVVGPPTALGHLYIANFTLQTPLTTSGLAFYVDPASPIFIRFPVGPSNALGQHRSDLALPVDPALIGFPLSFQYLLANPCAPPSWLMSDALQVYLQY